MLKKERPMLKKRTNDAGAMAKNDNVIEERVKKIMDSETINMKTCFRGLDCLLLRHSAKNIGGLLFLGFYCSIQ